MCFPQSACSRPKTLLLWDIGTGRQLLFCLCLQTPVAVSVERLEVVHELELLLRSAAISISENSVETSNRFSMELVHVYFEVT